MRENLVQCIDKLERAGIDGMITGQIIKDGLGSDLIMESMKDGNLRLKNLMEYVYYQQHGIKVITALAGEFEVVELLE